MNINPRSVAELVLSQKGYRYWACILVLGMFGLIVLPLMLPGVALGRLLVSFLPDEVQDALFDRNIPIS